MMSDDERVRADEPSEAGLTQTLLAMVEAVAATSPTRFETALSPIDGLFSADAERIIVRMLQECLRNVVQHAQATESCLTIERQPASVIMTVRDNGHGFDAHARLREQAALARVGEMAAVVAHEVRNPLAGIRGALQVIGSRLPAASQDVSVLKDVLLRIDSLNGIVDDLLEFARPRQLRRTHLAIGRFMTEAAAWLKQDHSMGWSKSTWRHPT